MEDAEQRIANLLQQHLANKKARILNQKNNQHTDSNLLIGLNPNQSIIEVPTIHTLNNTPPKLNPDGSLDQTNLIPKEDGTEWSPEEYQKNYSKHYSSKWILSETTRQKLLEKDPDYKFFSKVAGFAGISESRVFSENYSTLLLRISAQKQLSPAIEKSDLYSPRAIEKAMDEMKFRLKEANEKIARLQPSYNTVQYIQPVLEDIAKAYGTLEDDLLLATTIDNYFKTILPPQPMDPNKPRSPSLIDDILDADIFQTEKGSNFIRLSRSLISAFIQFSSTVTNRAEHILEQDRPDAAYYEIFTHIAPLFGLIIRGGQTVPSEESIRDFQYSTLTNAANTFNDTVPPLPPLKTQFLLILQDIEKEYDILLIHPDTKGIIPQQLNDHLFIRFVRALFEDLLNISNLNVARIIPQRLFEILYILLKHITRFFVMLYGGPLITEISFDNIITDETETIIETYIETQSVLKLDCFNIITHLAATFIHAVVASKLFSYPPAPIPPPPAPTPTKKLGEETILKHIIPDKDLNVTQAALQTLHEKYSVVVPADEQIIWQFMKENTNWKPEFIISMTKINPALYQKRAIIMSITPKRIPTQLQRSEIDRFRFLIQSFNNYVQETTQNESKIVDDIQKGIDQLQKRRNELLLGKIVILEFDPPYSASRYWMELPEHSGILKVDVSILAALDTAYTSITSFSQMGRINPPPTMNELRDTETFSSLFARLVAAEYLLIKANNRNAYLHPQEFHSRKKERENVLTTIIYLYSGRRGVNNQLTIQRKEVFQRSTLSTMLGRKS